MQTLISRQILLVGLIGLFLVGQGCVPASKVSVSDDQAKQNAESIVLNTGTEVVIQETVFGIGDALSFVIDPAKQTILFSNWDFPNEAKIDWSYEEEIETEESKAAQDEYEDEFAESPIGVDIPDRPERVVETVEHSGSVTTTALEEAMKIILPSTLIDGEDIEASDATFLTLSKKQYEELTQTRHSKMSIGMIDESISSIVEISNSTKGFIQQFVDFGLQENSDVFAITASEKWGTFTLMVGDEEKTVRTIQAENVFADFIILANETAPIVLKISPKPVSQVDKSISIKGYEAVSIQSGASSEDQPQPEDQ